ncbi:MAG TPA: hypothetical protein PKC30_01860 [Saprospiraceae bacterium]|nr:hypothetical protein [Saprospiraceae bacterium]
MQILGFALLIIHFILFFWAAGGIVEMIYYKVPWKPLTNPAFPPWVLVIHWGSVLFASVCFIYGYLTQWVKTPQIMALAYSLMALVCIIETFGYMTSKTKYLAMGAEFAAYITILFLLFKNHYFINHFGN